MPAAHDNRDEPGPWDPLMAVLTDAALFEEERADPDFMSEHDAATADLNRLRSELASLADILIGEPPVPSAGARAGESAGLGGVRAEGSAGSAGARAEGVVAAPADAPAGESAGSADVRADGAGRSAEMRTEGSGGSVGARAGEPGAAVGVRGGESAGSAEMRAGEPAASTGVRAGESAASAEAGAGGLAGSAQTCAGESAGASGGELAGAMDARVEGVADSADASAGELGAPVDVRAGESVGSAGGAAGESADPADLSAVGVAASGGGESEGPSVVRAPAPAAVLPLRRSRRRSLVTALRVVGVAAAGVVVVGSGLMVARLGAGGASDLGASTAEEKGVQASAGADYGEAADSPLGDPAYLACAGTVVEGDVTDVRAGADDKRVTLRVTHSYKPETAAVGAYVDITVPQDLDPLLAEGDHVLVGLSPGSASPDVWAVGESDIARERSSLDRALPQAERRTCETGE